MKKNKQHRISRTSIKDINIIFIVLFMFTSTRITTQQALTMGQYCSEIPFNPITSCNVTCTSCSPNNRNICNSCPPYLNLTQSTCKIPTNQKMFYFQYLDSTQLKTDDNLQLFRTNKAGAITSDNVLRVCSVGKYKFDVVGLFSNLDSFIYEESFPYEVSEVGLNFRLFHLTQVVVLSVLVNDKLAYNMSLDTGFNVSVDIFPQTQNNIRWNYANITNEPLSYANQIMIPIITPMVKLSSHYAKVTISVQQGTNVSNLDQFWGISQFTFIYKQCNTCVTDSVRELTRNLWIIIGGTSLAIIVLLFIVHLYEKIKKNRYREKVKKKFRNNQGSSIRYIYVQEKQQKEQRQRTQSS